MKNNLSFLIFIIASTVLVGLVSCQPGNDKSREEQIKFDQYVFHGKRLYDQHCANCHQKDGTGLGQLIPPIDSVFLSQNQSTVICAIKYGLEGSLTIRNQIYNGKMTGNIRLKPLEISEIMTYISSKWGEREEIISTDIVISSLKSCNDAESVL